MSVFLLLLPSQAIIGMLFSPVWRSISVWKSPAESLAVSPAMVTHAMPFSSSAQHPGRVLLPRGDEVADGHGGSAHPFPGMGQVTLDYLLATRQQGASSGVRARAPTRETKGPGLADGRNPEETPQHRRLDQKHFYKGGPL